jgi:putative transposase
MAPKYGKTKGVRSVSHREGKALLNYLLHPNNLTFAEVIKYAKEELERDGYEMRMCDETYIRWMKDHQRDNAYIHDLMRKGEKALNDKYLPSLERDRDKIEVGDILVADGHTMNFTMIDPVSGKARRMQLVMVYDFKSGMPVGWDFSATENTAVIASAFRRAIRVLGFVPRLFYVDNGRAFNSNYFKHSPNRSTNVLSEIDFLGMFDRLKSYGFTGCVNALPYHGQSKPIERWFGSMHAFEKQFSTYLGNSIENRVASDKRNEKLHRQLRERMTKGTHPEVTEVHYRLVEWIRSSYATRPSSSSAFYQGRTPLEVYEESIAKVREKADFAIRQISDGELLFLMMACEVRTVTNCTVRLFGRKFYSPELFGYKRGDERFVVRYDLLESERIDKVFVFNETGTEFICEAQDTLMTGHHPAARTLGTEEDRKRLDAALDEQGMLKKAAKQEAKLLIGKGYFEAIESEQARAIPSMREIEDKNKAIQEKTGTDGGSMSQKDRDELNERLLRLEAQQYEDEEF